MDQATKEFLRDYKFQVVPGRKYVSISYKGEYLMTWTPKGLDTVWRVTLPQRHAILLKDQQVYYTGLLKAEKERADKLQEEVKENLRLTEALRSRNRTLADHNGMLIAELDLRAAELAFALAEMDQERAKQKLHKAQVVLTDKSKYFAELKMKIDARTAERAGG